MQSRAIRQAYKRFADATRSVLRGDLSKQLELRSTLRQDARMQSWSETVLTEQIDMLTVILRTGVVQAEYNEHTDSHSVRVREDMLNKESQVTHLEILTPDEVLARLEGKEDSK